MGSIEADGLKALMDQQHRQNRDDIESLKEGQKELTQGQQELNHALTNLSGEISGATRVLKFLAWLIMAVFAALGLWFTSLEVRGKVADNRPGIGVSSSHQPQDARSLYEGIGIELMVMRPEGVDAGF